MEKKRPECVARIDAECPRVDSCCRCPAADFTGCTAKSREMDNCFFTVEEKIAALEKKIAELGGGWQPIETAPKDGRTIWIFNGKNAIAAWWHEGFGQYISEARRMTLARGYTFDDVTPCDGVDEHGIHYRDHDPVIVRGKYWREIPIILKEVR